MEDQRLQDSAYFTNGALNQQKEVTEDQIKKDTTFAEAYKLVNSYFNPEQGGQTVPDIKATMTPDEMDNGVKEFQGAMSDEDAATHGMQMVSDFRNALYTMDDGLGLVGTYLKLKDAPSDVKQAAYYMWKNYTRADDTVESFGRALKSMGMDPTVYTPAIGVKFFGTAATKKLLEKRFTTMLLSGASAGSFVAGEEFVRQEVGDIENKDLDAIQNAGSIGFIVGVAAPVVIGQTIKTIGKGINKVITAGEEEMAKMAGGGTPPKMETSLKDLKAKWKDKTDKLHVYENEDTISIDLIQVANKEQGTGSAIMNDIVDYANQNNKRIVLSPTDEFGSNKKRLTNFYKKFGFVENKGRNKDFTTRETMYRDPQGGNKQ